MLAVVAALALAAAPASASTLTGKVSGAKLPKAGKGITTVRAVNARTLVIADVAKVRSHRYRLKVPAGSYWMFAATTPFRGKAGVDRLSGKVSVRKGKRKKVPVSMRKRRRPRAHAAFVNVKYPAVWVQHFTVSDVSEYGQLRKGIADMLISDIPGPLEAACGGKVVEREKLNVILAEQVFTDPGNLPSTDRFIAHNREVTGSWTVAGGTATLTVNVTNVITGATRSVTRTGDADRFFELVPSVGPGDRAPALRQASPLLLRARLRFDVGRGRLHVTDPVVDGQCAAEVHGRSRTRRSARRVRALPA